MSDTRAEPITAIAVRDDGEIMQNTQLSEWEGSATRGLEARKEREAIVASVLRKGSDYGLIPGVSKPTLLKPGAEKIVDALNLYAEYIPLATVEDFGKPLFFYRYECRLRQRGSGNIVATGIGSCNSMEARYRWRNADRTCPKCGKAFIKKSQYPPRDNPDAPPGWYCHAKPGGCGANFAANDQSITSQTAGKIENDDVCTLTNTIDKMGQKRALVAASLNLGFSDQFTQDVEDISPEHGDDRPAASSQPARTAPAKAAPTKNEAKPSQANPPKPSNEDIAQASVDAMVKVWAKKFADCDSMPYDELSRIMREEFSLLVGDAKRPVWDMIRAKTLPTGLIWVTAEKKFVYDPEEAERRIRGGTHAAASR